MVIRQLLPLAFAGIAFVSTSTAAGKCNRIAQGSSSYVQARSLVSVLPEFRKWSASHSFPVAFGPNDQQVLLRGKCHWAVSVYADRSDRLEAWHLFFVHVPSKTILIQDPAGDEISLRSWRAKLVRPTSESMIPDPTFHPTANDVAFVV